MSKIHEYVISALVHTPGKQRTVAEIRQYVNRNFIRGPYEPEEISDALMDLAEERTVEQHHNGRWMIADKRKGGSINRPDVPKPKSNLSARINRIRD
jgi:hypothetical protein